MLLASKSSLIKTLFHLIISIVLLPYKIRGNWGWEKLNDLSKVSQLRNRGVISESNLGTLVPWSHWVYGVNPSIVLWRGFLIWMGNHTRWLLRFRPLYISFAEESMTHLRFFGSIKISWVSLQLCESATSKTLKCNHFRRCCWVGMDAPLLVGELSVEMNEFSCLLFCYVLPCVHF